MPGELICSVCSHKSQFSRRADTTPIGQGQWCHWFLTSCLERAESSLLNLKIIKKSGRYFSSGTSAPADQIWWAQKEGEAEGVFGGYLLTDHVGSSAHRSSNSDRGVLPLSLLTDTHEALGSTVAGSTGNTLNLIQMFQNILRKPPILVFTWIPLAVLKKYISKEN